MHPEQAKVRREARRFNVVSCGRRWGKTILGIDQLVRPAIHGTPVAWFSPTYPMLTEVWRDVKNVLAPVTTVRSEQGHRIDLLGGGVVDMWSLDSSDSVRGRKYRRVVLDEAAMVGNLEEAWNASIRPTLTDYRGDGWFLSTPRGMNFFWQGYVWGEDPQNADWASWRMPTVANPYIDPSEVEDARRQLPERIFAQEYLAEFLEDAGGVFRRVRESVDTRRTDNEPARSDNSYTLGVDLARVADFTVLTVLDQTGKQVYFERFNQISWERQIESIVRVAKAYNASVWLDSTGVGDPIYEALRGKDIWVRGYTLTNASKEQLIDSLAMAVEQGKRCLMDVSQQTSELLAYQYEITAARNVRMNAPAGMNDDCVIALALANWPLNKGVQGVAG